MDGLARMMASLAELLTRCGVAEDNAATVALLGLYLLATLVVVGFLAAVLRGSLRRRRHKASTREED